MVEALVVRIARWTLGILQKVSAVLSFLFYSALMQVLDFLPLQKLRKVLHLPLASVLKMLASLFLS